MKYQTEMSDEKLIQFYLNSNPAALATLTDLYKDRIYSSIYTMVQDKHVAEEIFRNVFITIINNLLAGKTPEDNNFFQWATQIAHQLCIDHSRNTKLAMVITADNAPQTEQVIDFSLPAPIHSATYHESHGKIKSMIDMLPDQQREVIALSHYAGLSFKDIAEIMKCSLTSALDTMKIGLNNLRKLMMEKEVALR
jgi:RNA polymerase sigma factor (sigma-70 family)